MKDILVNNLSVGIIGYGKFGALLHTILSQSPLVESVKVSSPNHPVDHKNFYPDKEVYQADVVIPCVPIRVFKNVVQEISQHLSPGQTVMDVCSVKTYPSQVMLDVLPKDVGIIASHPLFGPETYKRKDALTQFNMVMSNVRCDDQKYQLVKKLFGNLGLNIIEMKSEEHDQLIANSQFVALTTASIVKKLNLKQSPINTQSYGQMLEFIKLISADEDLVKDIYDFNPYCKPVFQKLDTAWQAVKSRLIDKPSV